MCSSSALVAIGLIYLRTNSARVVGQIQIPQTLHEVNNSNCSDFILRVICKNLIMWDSIKISRKYISSQIPVIVQFVQRSSNYDIYKELNSSEAFEDLDYQNISLSYYFIKVGTIVSLAIKFSGTGDRKLRKILLEFLEEISNVTINKRIFDTGIQVKGQLDEYSFNVVRTMCIVSLSLLMAGHCDAQIHIKIKEVISSLKTN